MEGIPANVVSNLVQRSVDRIIRETKYLCCFKCFVEDFEKEQKRLLATRKSVGEDIEEARQRNENRIDHETQQWLIEADSVIQEDTQAKKKWFFGLCTDCIWQYGRGKELFQKTQEIPKLIERRNNLGPVARPDGPPGMKFHYSLDFIHFESRKAKFEELKEALKNSNNHLVGLQGMGGTGKTTMATQVGKEVEESKLFDKVIFIVVSNPPDVEKIRSGIARHLVSKPKNAEELEKDAESLWSRITNGEEKILIILDDVWQELKLKDIGIPLGFHQKSQCSVLLTTRDMRVCKKMECQDTINLALLSEDDALNLFLLHAGVSVDSSSSDKRNMASNIVKECGRLPVAIVPVAKTLKSQSLEDWKVALIRLQNFDPILHNIDEDFTEVYKSLRLSYDNQKNEQAKELFLLYSVFPEDFELPIEDFGRIAIGLGLCGNADNYNIARSQVPEITHKLIDSSLLLKAENECVKMHDLVREVAQWIGNKEIQVIMDSKTILKENIRYSSWIIDGAIPNHFDGNQLEFLLIRINAEFGKLPDELFKDMIRLRVLILIRETEFCKTRTLSLPLSFHSLRNLRSLILKSWKLGDISILGNLQSLETLELTSCSITKFPNEIQALENLRLLGLKYCVIERNNPFKVIEGISQLEELYYVDNGDNLHKKNEDEEIHHVGTFAALQRYHIFDWGVEDSVSRCFKYMELKEFISEAAFKFLVAKAEILELGKYHKTGWTNLIPDIVPMKDGGMKDLIKLSLYSWSEIECLIHTKNLQSDVTIFSKLVELNLDHMDVKELCCGPLPTDFLKQLEKLYLYECSNLEGTLFKGKLDLGKLMCIKLKKCSMSSLFHPSTAQSLKQLEELEISYCYELKYIITDEGLGEDKVEDDPANPNEMSHGSMFSELKFVNVEKCNKLEFMLPIRFVEDLPLLEKVNIFYCEKLKHIFGQHQDNDEGVSYQKGKEIKLPSLQEMRICQVPNFINIFPAKCCLHPMSPVMKKSSTTKDYLKVKDPSLSCTFSWALICCFMPKSTATSIDNPIVSEAALPNRTGLQELKTQVFNPAECFFRPPLDPRNLREITITHCSNFTWLFTISVASSMPLLENLKVEKCHVLKHIFTNDRDDDDHKKYSSIFPKLKEVYVMECDLLESLFPASHFLTHLEVLKISGTPKLRYVLGKCDCDDNLPHQSQPAQESRQDVPNMDSANCLLRQPLNPLHLRQISIEHCFNLTSLFPLSIASSMSLLESLRVTDCQGLKHIVTNEGDNGHDHINYSSIFPNLKTISVSNCSFLEYIFPASHCRSLNHLEIVYITGAQKLRYVFGKCYCEDNLSHHNQNVEIHLPALEDLLLDDVPKMVSIGTQNCHFTALSLQTVQCPPRFVGVFQGIDFQKVLYLVVNNGDDKHSEEAHQEIVEYNENPASNTNFQLQEEAQAALAKKKLSPSQDAAKCLLRQPLLHLREMSIHFCSNLTSLFTLSIASSMSLLESLQVFGCDGLKHIVTNEGDNGHDHINYNSIFPNLKQISIQYCSFLEYIFPASHCRSLDHLESVEISDVEKLRYVFGKCYCEDHLPLHNQNVKIHLPALTYLRLDDVPKMVSIGTQNCHFTALSLETVECPTRVVGVFQGIDFQKVPRLVVRDYPNIPPTSSTKMDNDDDEHSEESLQEIIEYNDSETNSRLQEEAQAALSKKTLSPSQDMSVNKEAKNEKIIIDQEAEAETRPDMHSNYSKNNNEVSSGEGHSLEKDNKATSSTHSEPEIASPSPLNSTEEFHEKESMGDQEALGESKALDNTKEVDEPTIECSSKEISNKTALNIEVSVGEGPSLEKYNKPTSSTHCLLTSKLNESAGRVDKPLDNTQVEEPTDQCSSKERSNITALPIPSTLVEMKNLDKIIVNQSVIDNPKHFQEDDLIRLFRIMEKSADMEIYKPYVSKIAAVEDDNKVAKAFADLEISLKMGLQEIASSEANSLRLQDALSFLSTHYCEDCDPSHGLKPTIDSLHQEIPTILSSFNQVSARLAAIDTFTELEEKEKSVNEELPQRKEAAITLISEIYKTEKSMAKAQEKEAELKEQISRLQAELKNKEKEIKDCEIKLSILQEQKKKSVSETIGFLKEFEAVKKDRSKIVEDKMKVRQELEKWSSCVAKWWKATLLQGIYLKHKL